MEPLLPIRRRASQHPRRANRSPRGTRPSCTLTARPCAARQKAATIPFTNHKKNHQPRFIRNQQYSITAVSDGGGSVVERYAYCAYGQVTIADASGSVISNSAIANRYTYTGREWDEGLSLYHYRARMYDAVGGRFVSRDPIGFDAVEWNTYAYVKSDPASSVDPMGLERAVMAGQIPGTSIAYPHWYIRVFRNPACARDGCRCVNTEVTETGCVDLHFSIIPTGSLQYVNDPRLIHPDGQYYILPSQQYGLIQSPGMIYSTPEEDEALIQRWRWLYYYGYPYNPFNQCYSASLRYRYYGMIDPLSPSRNPRSPSGIRIHPPLSRPSRPSNLPNDLNPAHLDFNLFPGTVW